MIMIFRTYSRVLLATSICLLFSHLGASSIYVSMDSLGYIGSWEKYDTLLDAQNEVNLVDSGLVPQRDLQIYLSQDRASTTGFQLVTGWNLGDGNPSNTNVGFLQISDIGLNTVDTLTAGWTSASFDLFRVSLTGSNALGRISPTETNQEARLGVGPGTRSTNGNWLAYEMNLYFSNLSSTEPVSGIRRAEDEPADVFGDMFILFENPNALDLDGNPNQNQGFYRVQLSFNNISWAADHGVPEVVSSVSTFEATTTPVPESSTFAFMMSLGIFVVFLFRRRHVTTSGFSI